MPVALKIAPDIDAEQVKEIAGALLRHQIDAVIATNTTITRDAVQGLPHAQETGGLSGAPVFELSNAVIRGLKAELGDACRSSAWAASWTAPARAPRLPPALRWCSCIPA